MSSPYKELFEPISIGSMRLRNRICMPPMYTKYASESGEVTDRLIDYLVERAKGGVALIVVENTCIDWAFGRADGNPVTIHHDRFRPRLHDLVEAIHRHGAAMVTQLHHAGRQNLRSNVEGNQPPPAPSAVVSELGGDMPRAMTEEEIETTIRNFADGARRTKECGFDGVELHGAHGYLLAEFISPATNLCTDKWGGSFENRCRFGVEVVRRVRSEVGPDFPVLFRFSADERKPGALELEEGVRYAKVLENEGVDCLDVSGGFYDTMTSQFSMHGVPAGAFVPLAAAVKAAVDVPVIAVNSLGWDPELANRVVKEGKADLVHMGRALLADPSIPRKLEENRAGEIRPCIRCNECLGSLFRGWSVRCITNPELGLEYRDLVRSASPSKRIAVVGGGPAGLEYAVTASIRGHRVTLFEKAGRVGGQLVIAAIPEHKRPEFSRLVSYYEVMLRKLGVDVRLGKKASIDDVIRIDPDIVALAMGSEPRPLRVPGGERASSALEVLVNDARDMGKGICVVGGEGIALDTALFLREKGKNVTIVKIREEIGMDLNFVLQWHMKDLIEDSGVQVRTGHRVVGVTPNGVIAEVDDQNIEIDCDDVVTAVGFEPVDTGELEQALRDRGIEVATVGTCAEAGCLLDAIHGGFWAALAA